MVNQINQLLLLREHMAARRKMQVKLTDWYLNILYLPQIASMNSLYLFSFKADDGEDGGEENANSDEEYNAG